MRNSQAVSARTIFFGDNDAVRERVAAHVIASVEDGVFVEFEVSDGLAVVWEGVADGNVVYAVGFGVSVVCL